MIEKKSKFGLVNPDGSPYMIKEREKTLLKRVLLINPNHGGSEGFQVPARTEPLGLEYVAGAITDIVEDVRIHDDSAEPGGWKEEIRQHPPEFIGISCNYTVAIPEVKRLAKEIRKMLGKDIPIVIGGHAVSLKPDEMFIKEVDAIVIGQGEKPFREAIEEYAKTHSFEQVENIYYRNKDNEFISNVRPYEILEKDKRTKFSSPYMTELPEPRKDLVDRFRESYYLLYYPNPQILRTADGCTNQCIFCSSHKFNKEMYQSESADQTIKKLQAIPDKSYVMLPDDFAFYDTKAWNKIADYLIETKSKRRIWAQTRADFIVHNEALIEKLALAGLDMVLVGLESFDKSYLKKVGKGEEVIQNIKDNFEAMRILKKYKIGLWGAQILFPNFKKENFINLADINNEKKVESPQFAIYTPLHGTELYKKLLASGKLTGHENPRRFDLFSSVLRTTRMSKGEFYAWRDWLYNHTGSMSQEKLKQDVRADLTTWEHIRDFMDRQKQAYNTESDRYKKYIPEAYKPKDYPKAIEIFSDEKAKKEEI